MANLYILLPASEADAPLFGWHTNGIWRFSDAHPEDANDLFPVAIVPGTAVTRHAVQIAATRPAEVRQAALFAVEDDVAEPVDRLHIALGRPSAEGNREVLVTSAADMAGWMAWLSAHQLGNCDLVCAHSLMPDEADAFEGVAEILLRRDGRSFAVDTAIADDVLRLIHPAPDRVYGASLGRRLGIPPAGEGALSGEDYIKALASVYENAEPASIISLRQGAYARRRGMGLEGIGRWRFAGLLAAAAAILWLASVGLETAAYRDQAEALRTQTVNLISTAVPSANGNIDPALTQLRQTQRIGTSAVRPTIASAALYQALAAADGAEIRTLRYDAATGQLTALVLIGNYAEADAIAAQLEAAGLGVTLGQARQTGDQVLAELTIEGASS
ncbi:type II secretion system protein GspL [Henriciella marina]|uniref:Type II secretion system protein GspL n=1 Tax=Henriciella marina TaxID=453851 RepID=A0ABT4LTX1_9PROT|nr:type II secretion system protein GspL [Henriciella marina]MCZ4297816.1 type II secretion system protein GspL [Henriciella marina]